LRLILSESLRTVSAGVVVGWVLGVGIGRVLASTFVDRSAFDPWIFGLVPIGFVAAPGHGREPGHGAPRGIAT
jgi:ABC-type nitrate/sulfonate/bicarbonate transport system permease component